MSKTTYRGIDYSGPGSTVNRDSETRIRYGIISQHSIDPDVANDIGQGNWDDIGFKEARHDFEVRLKRALDDYYIGDRLPAAVEKAMDALDDWAESVEISGPYRLEEKDLIVQTERDGNDLWVFKSPFYTYAQFCSPCAPGACHLANPLEFDLSDDGPYATPDDASLIHGSEITVEQLRRDRAHEDVAGNKCYCLPHDWFENNAAPYPMWRVDTNEEVVP